MIRLFSRIGEVTFDDLIHRNFYLVSGGSVNGKALPVRIGDLKPRNFFDGMDIVERFVMQMTKKLFSIILCLSCLGRNFEKSIPNSVRQAALFSLMPELFSAKIPAEAASTNLILRRLISARKIASAIGLRQVFPLQTNSTFFLFITVLRRRLWTIG